MDALITVGSIIRVGAALVGLSLPGWVLLRWLPLPGLGSWPVRAALAVASAIAIHVLLFTFLALAGASFSTTLIIALAVSLISLPFGVRELGRGRRWIAPVLVALGLFVFGVLSTRPITALSDSPDHMATVREIIESGELEPNRTFYAEGDGVCPDIRKGYYHTWLAVLARISFCDPVQLWYALRPWALALSVLAFAALSTALLPSRAWATASLIAYPLLVHGNSAWFLDTILYPHNFNWILIWPALALMIGELSHPDRRRRVVLGIVAAATGAVHVFAPALLLSAALTVPGALVLFVVRGLRSRAFRIWLFMLAAALPVLLLRLVQTYQPINPLHIDVSERFYLTGWLSLHTFGPTFQRFSPAVVALLLFSIPLLWRRRRSTVAMASLVGLAWLPLLISFNPVAGAILQPKIGYLFVRFLGIIPYPIAAAAILQAVWSWSGRGRTWRWIPIALVGLLALVRWSPLWELTTSEMKARDFAISPERWRPGYELVEASLDNPSTIVTDPATAFALPAYTSHRIVALLNQHSSPSDSTIMERLRDVARILSPYRPMSEAVDAMRRRGTRHVLVNETFGRPLETFYDVRVPDLYPLVRDRFDAPGTPFRLLGAREGFRLYELTDAAGEDGGVDSVRHHPGRVTSDIADSVAIRVLNENVSLLSIEFSPASCCPGDTLWMRVALRKDRPDPAGRSYRMSFRARAELAGEFSRWRPVERLFAQLAGRTGGPRLEFTLTRRPLDGTYPINIWDVGEAIVDEFPWVVPEDVELGVYHIGFRVKPKTLIRNIALSGLLRPSGAIGAPVGTLVVVRSDS